VQINHLDPSNGFDIIPACNGQTLPTDTGPQLMVRNDEHHPTPPWRFSDDKCSRLYKCQTYLLTHRTTEYEAPPSLLLTHSALYAYLTSAPNQEILARPAHLCLTILIACTFTAYFLQTLRRPVCVVTRSRVALC